MMSGQQEDIAFTISFVKLVEQNPCLWNYKLKSYSRTDLTGIAWRKIAEKLKDTEQNCRDRWKNIRTAFGRSLKPPKSGAGGKSKKPYYLATQLDFLRPYMKGGSTSGNVPSEEEIVKQVVDDILSGVTTETQVQEGLPEDEEINLDNSQLASPHEVSVDNETEIRQDPTTRKKRKIIPQPSDVDKAFIDWLDSKKNKAQTPSQQEQEDGDWLFFRSLLPDFKKLDDRRKRRLKIKFATLINEELDLSESEASSTSISWASSARSYPTFTPEHCGPPASSSHQQGDDISTAHYFNLT